MSYFELLNTDAINHIFSFLDCYDIINTCIGLKLNLHNDIMPHMKTNIESNYANMCIKCPNKSLTMKQCCENRHPVCNDCLTKCNWCNVYFRNWSPRYSECGCNYTINATKIAKNNGYYGGIMCCMCSNISCPICTKKITTLGKYATTSEYYCMKCTIKKANGWN